MNKEIKVNGLSLGIDIGSTTAKIVLCSGENIIFEKYERHMSRAREKTAELIREMRGVMAEKGYGEDVSVAVAVSGSAGLGLAQTAGLPFVQEVFATGELIKEKEPDTSVVIELGGEDAKIIFFDGGMEERMNGSCAGGTGAFIDQMATLLNVTVEELDRLSLESERLYPIASRCGVFAKTDIQPLLNQGASKSDVAASIYQAVVNQTIAGLAQGRRINNNGKKVLFLGGPLYFCLGLRKRFTETLGLSAESAIFPDYARFGVALGAAIYAKKESKMYTPEELERLIINAKAIESTDNGRQEPLFNNEQEYKEFKERHAKASVVKEDIAEYTGKAYIGIDCGSTTTKLVLISENSGILYSYYSSNFGNPVELVKEQLLKIYELCSDRIEISGSAVTGYGEEIIKNAFSVGSGIVETIAHYTAARHFRPDVDFILDIGGQDIKCFKIRNGAIDSIMLNEACSSGCGSFLETFAKAMGNTAEEFAAKGLLGKNPVNLGTRCTVFMNSSVKQSQKDGATIEDISAGLSMSVVKNAIYKVIRASNADELGKSVVVQGGTFCNDAVLRAFEKEIGREVIRPDIAGLMGAYGAALYSREHGTTNKLIGKEELESFTHSSRQSICKGCTNNCHLTVNNFSTGKTFISGNRCEKAVTGALSQDKHYEYNMYEYKREYLYGLADKIKKKDATRGSIGLPMALGMYELMPLWYGVFNELGFDVRLSERSTRKTYERGQFTIPSDTICYPAKIMHGHVEALLEQGVDAIFYPCLSYNVDERMSDNHYNCPVVAYYSEVLNGNMDSLKKVRFLYPYLDINNVKGFENGLFEALYKYYPDIKRQEIKKAVSAGLAEYERFMSSVREQGARAVEYARANGKRIMILAGRPYHIDAEIGHGIDRLAASLGFVVVSEDCVCRLAEPRPLHVLNQWTYHSRLYRAAAYATEHEDTQLVQLVSFGCGVDAITTDEVREILEASGKLYTQIKIDEITNLGAVKIRLRSLMGAIEERENNL